MHPTPPAEIPSGFMNSIGKGLPSPALLVSHVFQGLPCAKQCSGCCGYQVNEASQVLSGLQTGHSSEGRQELSSYAGGMHNRPKPFQLWVRAKKKVKHGMGYRGHGGWAVIFAPAQVYSALSPTWAAPSRSPDRRALGLSSQPKENQRRK